MHSFTCFKIQTLDTNRRGPQIKLLYLGLVSKDSQYQVVLWIPETEKHTSFGCEIGRVEHPRPLTREVSLAV